VRDLAITLRCSEYRSLVVEVDEATYSALQSSARAALAYAVAVLERGDCDPKPMGVSHVEVAGVDLIDPVNGTEVVLYAEEEDQ